MSSSDPTGTGKAPENDTTTAKWTGTLDCEMAFPHELSIPVTKAADGRLHYAGQSAVTKYCREHGSSIQLSADYALPRGEISAWESDDQSAWDTNRFGDVI